MAKKKRDDSVYNRTITLKVAEVCGGKKDEFYKDLRNTLDVSRRIYNAAMSECVAQDSGSFCLDKSIPKRAKISTYKTLAKGKEFGKGYKGEFSSIVQSAESKYTGKMGSRFMVLTGQATLPLTRSWPWPLLINPSAKRCTVEIKDGSVWCDFYLIGQKWRVRMASGSNYKDQIRGLQKAKKIGDSKIYLNRRGVAMIGFGVSVEKPVPSKGENVLSITTATDNLLCLSLPRSNRPYVINADYLASKMEQNRIRQRKLRYACKPGQKRKTWQAMSRAGGKMERRIDAYIHDVSAQVVGYAKRHKVGLIKYDDTIRSYLPKFRWYELGQKIAQKCEREGIRFEKVGTAFEPCENICNPHVYFRVHLSMATGKVIGIKIGETQDGTKRNTVGQAAVDEVYVAAFQASDKKAARIRQEKKWHKEFREYKIKGEVFDAKPVIESLWERQAIDETLGGSRVAEILDMLGINRAGAVSGPKGSEWSNG